MLVAVVVLDVTHPWMLSQLPLPNTYLVVNDEIPAVKTPRLCNECTLGKTHVDPCWMAFLVDYEAYKHPETRLATCSMRLWAFPPGNSLYPAKRRETFLSKFVWILSPEGDSDESGRWAAFDGANCN